jgi:UDP-4-amino-4,6-dideoxy-N-acetyl-beta-L-altrosamine transaminase
MIPYGRQSINEEDIVAVINALKSEWLTTGPLVEQFEEKISSIVGAGSVSVSSGTAALHCAYAAIGIEPGDEVITPPITFIATQATAAIMGAKIVFADVEADTANINPDCVESLITSKTKAIVAVDYAGHPAELLALRKIADKYGIYLIEDAAHSIGSKFRGRLVGSIADLTTFSFFPTKNITTGEGGAVSSNNPELLDKAKKFARHGLIRDKNRMKNPNEGPWHQEVHAFGLNYRLPDILCALGLSQISRITTFKAQRNRIFDNYSEAFKDNLQIQLPTKRDYVDPMWHLFPIQVKREIRSELFSKLRSLNINVQVNYMPAYFHPIFADLGYKKGLCPTAENFYNCEISLPLFSDFTESDQEKVITEIKNILQSL